MNPKPTLRPSVGGKSGRPPAQSEGDQPCGEKMVRKRVFELAASFATGVKAGNIESSNGKDNVTPTPRRNVRRAICFLVINTLVWPPLPLLRSTVHSPSGVERWLHPP